MPIIALIFIAILYLAWRICPRRRNESGFKYVYINQDGSARELCNAEREFLSIVFHGADSSRPYIKWGYPGRDGYGSLSGFLLRNRVPRRITIQPVNPNFDQLEKECENDLYEEAKITGDIIKKDEDGSITVTFNPKISRKKRFKLVQDYTLEKQRKYEKLAQFNQ